MSCIVNNAVKFGRTHPCPTAGILGIGTVGGGALIAGGVIAFVIVMGRFPSIHLSGVKMIVPVSVTGGVSASVGILLEVAVLGAILMICCKKTIKDTEKSSGSQKKLSEIQQSKVTKTNEVASKDSSHKEETTRQYAYIPPDLTKRPTQEDKWVWDHTTSTWTDLGSPD